MGRPANADTRTSAQDLQSIISLLDPRCGPADAQQLLGGGGELFRLAQTQHVAAVLHHRWSDSLLATAATGDRASWQRLAYTAAALPVLRRAETLGALRALNQAGVEPIVMRGLWLAEKVYPDPAMRPYADVDLVVPIESVNAAMQALGDRGYECHEDVAPIDPGQFRRLMAAGYYEGSGAWSKAISERLEVQLDLHTSLAVLSRAWWPYRPTPEYLYERTQPWTIDGIRARAFEPHFSLIALCENMCRHGLARPSRGNLLIRHYDVLLVCNTLGDDDWDRLVDDGRELHMGPHVATVLRAVEGMWGRHWPAGLVRRLSPGRLADGLARYAATRPGWLGLRGRIALFHACALGGPGRAAWFLAKNVTLGVRSLSRQ